MARRTASTPPTGRKRSGQAAPPEGHPGPGRKGDPEVGSGPAAGGEPAAGVSASAAAGARAATGQPQPGSSAAGPAAATPVPAGGPAAGRTALPPRPRPLLIRRSPEETAALRATIADSEAESHALRAALDQLRHDLESGGRSTIPPPPEAAAAPDAPAAPADVPAAPSRPARRPRWLIASTAVAGLSALGVAAALVSTHGHGDTPAASVPAASTPTGSAPAGQTGGAAPIAHPTPLPWPGGPVTVPPGLPSAGPGITAPGSNVAIAADPDRVHLDVYEQAVVDVPRPAEIRLAPASINELKPPLGTAPLSVQDLQVAVDGRVAQVRPGAAANSWTVVLPAADTPAHVVLRYRVRGAFVRQEPAPQGRVTVVLTPLTAAPELAAGMPVELRYLGPGVSTMTCPQAPQGQQLCGRRTATSWQASLPAGGAVVLVQATMR